ncbi:hypothetical protein [Nocardia rhizosphaerae]|uniref:Uncharacterized protein n=1 Tax=Nocardia rhizosphaerae TaxID=1691571 RepID=A0ABV8KZR3_9NOCA
MGIGRARAWVAGYCAVLALIIVGPLAGSGYLLLRDAVSTPRSYLTDSALGLGAAAPRAVPQDAMLAVLSPFVDGGLLVKTILLVALWAAGYGAAVLVRDVLHAPAAAQLVAATIALWNPFVAERLLQGHWSLLAGYAALPWTAVAAARLRRRPPAFRHREPTTRVDSAHATVADDDIRDSASAATDPTVPAIPPTRPSQSKETGQRAASRGAASARPLADSAPPRHGTGASAPATTTVPPQDGTSTRIDGPSRRGTVGAWAALVASFAAAGLTPTGSLLAAVIGLALVGWRRFPAALLLWFATCAPWLTATALGSGAEPSDPAGVTAFAARAEPWLGTLGSLAGLGGIWNSEAVPASRTTPLAFLGTLLLLVIVALGARTVWASGRDGRTLLVIACVAVVLPALGATGAGIAVGEWLVVHVPGAGLLRDTQKYVALALPAYALCAGAACLAVTGRLRRERTGSGGRVAGDDRAWSPPATSSPTDDHGPDSRARHAATADPFVPASDREVEAGQPMDMTSDADRRATGVSVAAALLIALLVLPLADLAWGVGGQMRAVHYPAGWGQVAARIDGPGDVAVLPTGMFRVFPYSGTAPVLDPAPRILPNDVLQTGELLVRGHAVTGEGNRARTIEEALLRGADPTAIADLGVGWILLERTTPGPHGDSERTLAATELVYEDQHLALYRIASPTSTDTATPTQRRLSTAAHTLWAALLLGSLIAATLLSPYSRRVSRCVIGELQDTPSK